jgi:hypothetical protein
MFARLAVSWVSRAAKGSGTGVGGSPKRRRVWPPSVRTSSMVRRVSRLTGWAQGSTRRAATRVRSGSVSSVRTCRRTAIRRSWVMGSVVARGWAGMPGAGACRVVMARVRKPRSLPWWRGQLTCQSPVSAWAVPARCRWRAASQDRNRVAEVNCPRRGCGRRWPAGLRGRRRGAGRAGPRWRTGAAAAGGRGRGRRRAAAGTTARTAGCAGRCRGARRRP